MNLFSLAERLSADEPAVSLDDQACTHGRNRFSQCRICIQACPVHALSLDTKFALNAQACTACGACLPLCPVGALSGPDGAADLVSCAARTASRVIELVCGRHPSPETGPDQATAALQTERCLAALGPATYVWLLAGPTERVIVRLDACAECPIGANRAQIERTLATARDLAPAADRSERLAVTAQSDTTWRARPVVSTKNPPLSRRDLFRALSVQAPKLATQAFAFQDRELPTGKAPPPERRRLLNALRRLPAQAPSGTSAITHLTANAQCTACNVCVRICPTGALRSSSDSDTFRLEFVVGACTDCDLCLDVCDPRALSRGDKAIISELVSPESTLLRTMPLQTCVKCSAKFAGAPGSDLCPPCEYRRHNPFGSRRPARME